MVWVQKWLLELKLRKVHLYSDLTTPKSPEKEDLKTCAGSSFFKDDILTHVLKIGGSCWVASRPPADPE